MTALDLLVQYGGYALALGIVLFLVAFGSRYFVNVGAREIAIKERRYAGRRMPPGRVVAMAGEVGIQADVLKPGLHLLKWPLERVVQKVPLVEIRPDELGVIEAVDGDPLPAGRIFAPDKARNKHDNFQNPIAFLTEGGVKGTQLRTLPPGLWPIHPYLFRVSIAKVTVIPQESVGIVTAADGSSLESGRILARAVDGHNNFQDAEGFLSADGQKGVQVQVLTPGTYRIMTASAEKGISDQKERRQKVGLFSVACTDAIDIKEDEVGLVEALDGAPLASNDYVAPSVEGHNNYQSGETFIKSGGRRGPQKDVLLPGTYYINPMLFKVTSAPAGEVKPGEVAVIVSNVGLDPTEEIRQQVAARAAARTKAAEAAAQAEMDKTEDASSDPADSRLDGGTREAYVVPDGYRGIREIVLGPGRYRVNTWAVTPVIIPTTNQTVEWTQGDPKEVFDPFEVISKDGFTMKLEVRVVFRVRPEDAPFMVAKIGSVDNLIDNVMHPLVDSIFRNQASESSAMAYLQNRHEEQTRAETRVRTHLLKYHADVVNVLICHIHLPEQLMATQTERILAEQRMAMFDKQQEAEGRRIQLEKTKAQADNQAALMREMVGVDISKQKADQRKAEADGAAYFTLTTGNAEAARVKAIGEAQGAAYREQVNALGQQGVAVVESLKIIGERNVRITPDIQASGSDGGGGIGQLMLMNLFKQQIANGKTDHSEG